MKNKGLQGIILDYGGTLDSNGIHWAHIIWDAYRKQNIPVSEEDFRQAYIYAERYLAQHKVILPDFTFADLMQAKIKIEFSYLAENNRIKDADVSDLEQKTIAGLCYEFARKNVNESREVIKTLSDQYPLVLVSNFYGNVQSVLQDFGIAGYFTKIIESAVEKVRKPDPAIFRLGVDALGMNPEEVTVIGDSYAKDIVPAKSIGCQTCWIKNKGWDEKEETDSSFADYIFSNFAAVQPLFIKS